jgi:hypothetical protein
VLVTAATPEREIKNSADHSMTARPRRREQIRWAQLILVVLIGVPVAAFGVAANVRLHWTDIWPEVFLTVGATFALGGVLFVLQRSWVTEVTTEMQQAEEQVEGAVRVVNERAAEIEEQLQARRPIGLDELRGMMDSHTATVVDERRSAISVLRDDLSFDNLSAVLGLAEHLNAVAPGFRARAAALRTGPRVQAWLVDKDERGFSIDPFIDLSVLPLEPDAGTSEAVQWRSCESVSEVIVRLIEACQRANLPSTVPALDSVEAFRRLIESLDTALSVRQGAPGPRLKGALVEMLDGGWTLTSFGLENRFRSIAVPLGEFVDYYYERGYEDNWTAKKHLKQPAAPEYVTDIDWEFFTSVVWTGLPSSPPSGISPIYI